MGKKDKKLTREPVTDNSNTRVSPKDVELKRAEDDNRQKPHTPVITAGTRKSDTSFRNLPTININVFAQISGIKPDQLAGFYYYAKRNDIKRLTRPEWEAAYKKFMTLPVK